MRRIFLLCLVFSITLGSATAFAAFKGWDVRAMGMGGAFIAVADDVNTININPAGLGFLNSPQAQVSYLHGTLSGLDNYNLAGFEYLTPVGKGTLGGSFSRASYDQRFSFFDPYLGGISDNFSMTAKTYCLAYGVKLDDNLAVGIHFAKEDITSTFSGLSTSTSNTDTAFGALYKDPYNQRLTYGVVMGNTGNNTGFYPGVAYHCDDKTLLAADFGDDVNIGVERHLNDKWTVRAGSAAGTFTCGAGYNLNKDIRIDYAHQSSLNAIAVSAAF